MRKLAILVATTSLIVLTLFFFVTPAASSALSIGGGGVSILNITQQQSGLVASDPLNHNLSQQQLQASTSLWFFGGDAFVTGSPYSFYEDSGGLHLGIAAPSAGHWQGIYAVANLGIELAHATITVPSRTIPSNFYDTGLYIQTADANGGDSLINYVFCGAGTSSYGTQWFVEEATGNAQQATSLKVLYVDNSANQPLTRQCTIITDGNNYLAAYIDNSLVYQNYSAALNYNSPFYVFLEVQSSYSGSILYGTFNNFYATTSGQVTVNNIPVGATSVSIVDSSGNVLATTPVNGATATLDISQYTFPLNANIIVYGALGVELASTSSASTIYGGDIWAVQSLL
jgi:hypothetical protein